MSSIAKNIISKCPKCHSDFRESDIHVLEWPRLGHVSCIVCKSKLIINIIAKKDGFVCTGIVTDLFKDELLNFMSLDPLTEDDIIAMQKELTLDKIVNFR